MSRRDSDSTEDALPRDYPPPFLDDPTIAEEISAEGVSCCVCGHSDGTPIARAWDYEYRTSRQSWTYKRCPGCALVYLDPRPRESELRSIYPPHYYSFDEARRTNPFVEYFRGKLEASKTRLFERHVGTGPRRILDVGCGDGRFMESLIAHGDPAWQVSGIDIDEGAIARARSKGLDARLSRLEDLDADAGSYHMVVLFQVLEHVADPRAMVAKVRELLRPGGVFVIETPDVAGWDERWFRSGLWGGYHVPRHWNLFTPDNLERLLVEEGFQVQAKRPLISTSFWINSLYNRALVAGAGPRTLAFLDYQNPLLLALFIMLDTARMAFGARTSNQRVIARRAEIATS
ncbi:MAG: class I SAM-dependent methyltransferase [Planctomycetota bacterium]|jgi:2-polyprenyl-3-methyl-5-hydroxy-6-metoxy-1,4-benzoquinol methylase